MNKIADLYLRLSSKPQEKGLSRETQEEKCREYCKKQGYIVRNIYYENKSAMKAHKRPVFEEMIAEQHKNKADVIISFCLNRLVRNQYDFEPLEELVDKLDMKIICLQDNLVVQKPFKAHEKFLVRILTANAEFEVNHMNEIRRLGLIKRAQTGIRPSKLNYGYTKLKSGNIAIVPKQAEFVRRAYELYATGKYSLSNLPETLYTEGLIYRNQKSGKIPKATLSSMLKSKFYTGKYTFPDCENEIKGKHKAIISDELFDKVQSVLKNSTSEKLVKHEFLYSNLLVLKGTDTLMTGDIKKKKYIYYTCRNEEGRYICVNEEIINKEILSYLKEIRLNLIPKELINEVLKEILKPLKQELATLRGNVSRKYHRELELQDNIDENEIDDFDLIEEEYALINKKYSNLSLQISVLENKIATIKSDCENLMTKRLSDVFISLDFKSKREVISLIKNKFEVDSDKKVKLTFKSAFRKIRKR